MNNFYVPFTGESPAAVTIKGHRFIILSRDRIALEQHMDLIGADHLQEYTSSSVQDEDRVLNILAQQIQGGIVIAPTDMDVGEILFNLESELPWLQ